MLIIRRASTIGRTERSTTHVHRHAIHALIIGSAVMIGLVGCGQKGDLYIANTNSTAADDGSNKAGSEMLPHAGDAQSVDNDDDQNLRDLEQIRSDVDQDSNDY